MAITFNRNSWHRRLQKYVLSKSTGKSEDTFNLCPYFWLTIFCLFAVPFVYGHTQLNKLMDVLATTPPFKKLSAAMNSFDTWMGERYDTYIAGLSPMDIYHLDNKDSRRSSQVLSDWFAYVRKHKLHTKAGYNDVWDYRYALLAEYRQKLDNAKLEAHRKKMARERKLQQLGKIFAVIFLVGLFSLASFVIWYLLTEYTFTINWTVVLNVFAFLGGVVLIVGIATFLDKVGIRYKLESSVGTFLLWTIVKPLKYLVYYPIKGIALGFKYIFIIIKEGFSFIWTYFKNTKDNFCPSIDWK